MVKAGIDFEKAEVVLEISANGVGISADLDATTAALLGETLAELSGKLEELLNARANELKREEGD